MDEISKPEISEIDQIINTIAEKQPVKYTSNGVELKTTLKRHYFDILDMENGKVYDREMILNQVKKQYAYYQEDVTIGYKTKCNLCDIVLAEEYVIDNYNYLVYLN